MFATRNVIRENSFPKSILSFSPNSSLLTTVSQDERKRFSKPEARISKSQKEPCFKAANIKGKLIVKGSLSSENKANQTSAAKQNNSQLKNKSYSVSLRQPPVKVWPTDEQKKICYERYWEERDKLEAEEEKQYSDKRYKEGAISWFFGYKLGLGSNASSCFQDAYNPDGTRMCPSQDAEFKVRREVPGCQNWWRLSAADAA